MLHTAVLFSSIKVKIFKVYSLKEQSQIYGVLLEKINFWYEFIKLIFNFWEISVTDYLYSFINFTIDVLMLRKFFEYSND